MEQERRKYGLSEEDIEKIAVRQKELAKRDIYVEIGKTTVSIFRWVLCIGALAGAAWLGLKGYAK